MRDHEVLWLSTRIAHSAVTSLTTSCMSVVCPCWLDTQPFTGQPEPACVLIVYESAGCNIIITQPIRYGVWTHNLLPHSSTLATQPPTDYGSKLEDPASLGAALTGKGLGKI